MVHSAVGDPAPHGLEIGLRACGRSSSLPAARRLLAPGLGLLALAGSHGTARAQTAPVGGVSAERLQPAPGPRNFVTVETARVAGDMAFSFGLVASYAYDPFRLQHCLPSSCSAAGAQVDRLDVVKSLFTANLLASLTPLPRLQIGVRLPVAYAAGQGVVTDPTSAGYGEAQPGGITGFAMGDPAIEVKVRVLGQPTSRLTAGLSALISAPVGHATAPSLYVGDTSPVGVFRAILDADLGRFFLAANAGAAVRSDGHLGSLDLGPEFRAAAAAGLKLGPDARLAIEGFGSTNFTATPGTNAAELDLEGQTTLPRVPVALLLGGGAGLNQGVGAPLFRVFAGVGVDIERSREVVAAVDPDLDKDGIPNEEDKCPLEGGDVVRVHGRFYGCPRRDSDGDGIPDYLDACPDIPGVASKDPALNGCPDPDRDHDGIPNEKDKCPDEPETYNGFQDADGCPDVAPLRVEVRTDRDRRQRPHQLRLQQRRDQRGAQPRGPQPGRPGAPDAPGDQAARGRGAHGRQGHARRQPGPVAPAGRRRGPVPREQGRRRGPPRIQRVRARQAARLQCDRGRARRQPARAVRYPHHVQVTARTGTSR